MNLQQNIANAQAIKANAEKQLKAKRETKKATEEGLTKIVDLLEGMIKSTDAEIAALEELIGQEPNVAQAE